MCCLPGETLPATTKQPTRYPTTLERSQTMKASITSKPIINQPAEAPTNLDTTTTNEDATEALMESTSNSTRLSTSQSVVDDTKTSTIASGKQTSYGPFLRKKSGSSMHANGLNFELPYAN